MTAPQGSVKHRGGALPQPRAVHFLSAPGGAVTQKKALARRKPRPFMGGG